MGIKFIVGQRWLSEAEPELGLGTIRTVDARQVQVDFPSAEVSRRYAPDSAPLRRIRFTVGDCVTTNNGHRVTIDRVTDNNGILVYHGSGCTISESNLSDTMDFSSPEERLSLAKVDGNSLFNLRFLTHKKHAWLERSRVRGLLGARITLLPHQLHIASEISRRYHARVLLGDEVGLGKTIEAGLILHHQIVTGLCIRVLVLLPESLTHQWFLELWRRFNLRFSLFDEDRCQSIEAHQPHKNPFLDSTWVICSLNFLVGSPIRRQQALSAGWDMLIVDEVHHLAWSPGNPSLGYELVEEFAERIPSVLLLSGTPEQLGETGHFARLRLLDPQRFHDLKQFQQEQKCYVTVASIVDKLLDKVALSTSERETLGRIYHYNPEKLEKQLKVIEEGAADVRQAFIAELVDRHGTGRLFYRNQRSSISGFPQRRVEIYPLPLNHECSELLGGGSLPEDAIGPEFRIPPAAWKKWWQHDPRVGTVLKLLERYPNDKILLICARRESVQALQEAIERRLNVPLAVFHENLPLIVRDRQAAYFADPGGARLLICSEIGSEGRNFQFCHHLILFDLPKNPELLEQRIGRLDRIGQSEDIYIHVFYLERTPQEVLARWYHEGLNAFRQPLIGASQLYAEIGDRVGQLSTKWFVAQDHSQLQALIADTWAAKKRAIRGLAKGRDRLLEWHSHRPDIGNSLVEEIEYIESRSELALYMENLCQHLGVYVEDHDHNSLVLRPGDLYRGLPGLPDGGLPVTFSRQRALTREDTTFLSWEHPMVVAGMDQLLSSWDGRASYGLWEDVRSRILLLEAIFIVHSLAPRTLRPERYLPPTPLRILTNHLGADLSEEIGHDQLRNILKDDPQASMLKKPEVTQQLIPAMIQRCRELVNAKKQAVLDQARTTMQSTLDPEIERLTALLFANTPVRPEEIEHLRKERRLLDTHFVSAVARLDAVRFIWRGPPE